MSSLRTNKILPILIPVIGAILVAIITGYFSLQANIKPVQISIQATLNAQEVATSITNPLFNQPVTWTEKSLNASKLWPVFNDDQQNLYSIDTGFEKGTYLINASVFDKRRAYSLRSNMPTLSDFVYNATLNQTKGSDDEYFGIGFRMSSKGYYRLIVNRQGNYALDRYNMDQNTYSRLLFSTDRDLINEKGDNTLGVLAKSSRIQISINGTLLGDTIDDSPIDSGIVGIIVELDPGQSISLGLEGYSVSIINN